MKKNVWVSVLSALLIVGVLIGAVVWIGKGTSGGGGGGTTAGTTAQPEETTTAKPAETTAEVQRKTVVTNANAKYAYRENAKTNEVVYIFYSDELKPNTKYSVVFNFSESDYQSFTSTHGLSFKYTIALSTTSETLGDNLVPDGGMKSGYYYDFETNENGAVVFGILRGSIPTGDNAAKLETYTEICHYIRDNLLFQISEIVG